MLVQCDTFVFSALNYLCLRLTFSYDATLFSWLKDIASKLMAFSEQGPRTICILSAHGAICNVTLRQPAAMGGSTVAYEVCMLVSLKMPAVYYAFNVGNCFIWRLISE